MKPRAPLAGPRAGRRLGIDAKYQRLRDALVGMGRVAVAFSGGVDSTFLLRVAIDTLGDNAIGLLAVSPSLASSELDEARALARSMDARLVELDSRELMRPGYRRNAGDRCYHCKVELFELAGAQARRLGVETLCYGAIPDDLGDHRPGMLAADEYGVRAPLVEAGLTKTDIRWLSRELGLPTWDKPATACLSSRFPYGTEITTERLDRIGRCEARLRMLGLREFRARFHDKLVRVEIAPVELPAVFADAGLRASIVEACKAVGFTWVAIDLEGYRSGSTNEALVQVE